MINQTRKKRIQYLSGITLSLMMSTAVYAADEATNYTVASQPLGQALAILSEQADVTVFAPSELTSNKNSVAISDINSLNNALELMLKDTELEATKSSSGTIIIKQRSVQDNSTKLESTETKETTNALNAVTDVVVVVGQTSNIDITKEDLDRLQANDLADIFRDIPSVSVGGSLGIAQKIYVRGVEDTLLNVTVDGAPQTSTLFHHIGRVNIDPELLKQVEVQAGAGEATSGFGAIGGAIRFKTKNAEDLLKGNNQIGGTAKAAYFSNDGYKLSGTLYGRLSENWNILGSYVHVDRDNMEDGNNDKILGSAAEQSLAFFKLNGNLSENQELSLSYEQRDEKGEFSQRPNWRTIDGAPLFSVDAKRQTIVGNYMFSTNNLINIEATGYFTKSKFTQDRNDRWGEYEAIIETMGFDIRNTSIINKHNIQYGVEYRSDKVTSKYLADSSVWGLWAWDPSVGKAEEKGRVFGLYLQDHFEVTEDLTLSAGARYDDYNMEQITYDDKTSSNGLSVNAGLLYDITPALSVTVGYAQAIRGKEIGDAFTLEKQPGRLSLDPSLKAEKADNKEIGLTYNDGTIFASATYYDSRIKNVILDQLGRGAFPQDSVYYENTGTFQSDGFEFRFGFTADQWRFDTFYTTYNADFNGNPVEGYEHNGLANASGDKIVANLAFMPTGDLELGWRTTHVANLNDIEVLHRAVDIGWIDRTYTVDKPGYTTHDFYIQWFPQQIDGLRVNLAVNNIFNKLYRNHSSVADYKLVPDWEGVVGLYDTGRDIRASVSFEF
ncbi:MAG: TonB-dependent receptor [Emcibacteraceae bacterium]|nr:TonB-dependent receptor [Emcibacteraceae bacterium]